MDNKTGDSVNEELNQNGRRGSPVLGGGNVDSDVSTTFQQVPKPPEFQQVPMLPEVQEVRDPFFSIPEEIWEMILSKGSSLDRLNICRTNSRLDSMLGRTKSQWLLDQVLPFLLAHIIGKATILKCRQVCKKWRNVIDNMLESEHPNRRPFNKDHSIEKANSARAAVHSSLRRWQLEYIQFTPRNSHKFSTCPSPVPVGRAISFSIDGSWDEEKLDEFWIAANTFLESHGHHIWHVKIVHFNVRIDCVGLYMILCECLKSLPNLRSLEIRSHLGAMGDNEDHARVLQPIIEAHPLPPVGLLNSLDVAGVPRIFQQHILTQFSTSLKKLSLSIDTDMDFDQFEMNLEEVLVKHSRNSGSFHFRELNPPTWLPTTCTKISLELSRCTAFGRNGFINFLQRFDRLAHLRIIVDARPPYVGPSDSCFSWEVPSLECFEVEGDGTPIFSFSSLYLGFPNLRFLHLRDTADTGMNGDLTVQRGLVGDNEKLEIEQWLYRKQIHLSPIWETLSKLRVLTFESVNGTLKAAGDRQTVNLWWERRQQIIISHDKDGRSLLDRELINTCVSCKNRCWWEASLIQHQKLIQERDMQHNPFQSQFPCNICGLILGQHMKTYSIRENSELTSHSSEITDFSCPSSVCDVCGKFFQNKVYLCHTELPPLNEWKYDHEEAMLQLSRHLTYLKDKVMPNDN